MEQGRMEMRMMLPMSIQCEKCGNFMYRGSKFNSKKEDVIGESYMGIKIFRFIMKCTQCNGFFSIKTDPKNADYCVEYGVTRNYEPWREQRAEIADEKVQREEEGSSDAMRSLEQRTEDSRRQLEMLDDLEELRAMKAAHGLHDGMTAEQILALSDKAALEAAQAEADAEEEDTEVARAAFAASRRQVRPQAPRPALTAPGPAQAAPSRTESISVAHSSTSVQQQSGISSSAAAPTAGVKRARPEDTVTAVASVAESRFQAQAAPAAAAAMPAFPFAKRQAVVAHSQALALPIALKPKQATIPSAGPPAPAPHAPVHTGPSSAHPPASMQTSTAGVTGGLVDYGSSGSDSEG